MKYFDYVVVNGGIQSDLISMLYFENYILEPAGMK